MLARVWLMRCRRHALSSATAALFQLVRVFPMVTFHQALQRFAVGNSDGFIIIYDLRTATKWRVLDAHSGNTIVVVVVVDIARARFVCAY